MRMSRLLTRYWLAIFRLVFGILGVATVFILMVNRWDAESFRVSNYFSFFTIQSNLMAAAILIYGAVRVIKPDALSRRDILRGAIMLYMAMTGIVYGLLLSGYQEALQTTVAWADTVLHKIIPLVMVIDWLVDPPAHRITWRQARWWIVYPVAYLIYSLIRGPIVDWYPYPFVDPDESGGYLGVAANSVGISLGVLLAIWLVIWASKRRARLVAGA